MKQISMIINLIDEYSVEEIRSLFASFVQQKQPDYRFWEDKIKVDEREYYIWGAACDDPLANYVLNYGIDKKYFCDLFPCNKKIQYLGVEFHCFSQTMKKTLSKHYQSQILKKLNPIRRNLEDFLKIAHSSSPWIAPE